MLNREEYVVVSQYDYEDGVSERAYINNALKPAEWTTRLRHAFRYSDLRTAERDSDDTSPPEAYGKPFVVSYEAAKEWEERHNPKSEKEKCRKSSSKQPEPEPKSDDNKIIEQLDRGECSVFNVEKDRELVITNWLPSSGILIESRRKNRVVEVHLIDLTDEDGDVKPVNKNPKDMTCSCRCIGDCPIKDLSKDGSCDNGLCTADELRNWLKRVISAQELMYWRDRCQKAESTINFIKQTTYYWEDPVEADED